jgi:hypothetical protein
MLGVLLLAAAATLLWCPALQATKGVDVSSPTSKSAFSCLQQQGYEFLIVRGYRSYGEPDGDAAPTVANAKAAGIQNADVYMFPCPKCSKSAKEQVDDMGKYCPLQGYKIC